MLPCAIDAIVQGSRLKENGTPSYYSFRNCKRTLKIEIQVVFPDRCITTEDTNSAIKMVKNMSETVDCVLNRRYLRPSGIPVYHHQSMFAPLKV